MTVDLDEINPKAQENFEDVDSSSWYDGIASSRPFTFDSRWKGGIQRSSSSVSRRRWERGLERAGVENTEGIGDVWADAWEEDWEEYKNSQKMEDDAEKWENAWQDKWREYRRSEEAGADANTWARKVAASSYLWKIRWENKFGDASNWDV